jgi:hypothetical protein
MRDVRFLPTLGDRRRIPTFFSLGNASVEADGLLTCEAGGVVSFTVAGFSGYAVTGVPEPGTLVMLVLGGLTLIGRRRRRYRFLGCGTNYLAEPRG